MWNSNIVKIRSKRQYWGVKRQGFGSLYGMFLLSIMIAFVVMLQYRIRSQVVRNEQLAFVEVYAIQVSKQLMHEQVLEKQTKVAENETIEANAEELMEEQENENEVAEEEIHEVKIVDKNYEGYTITFEIDVSSIVYSICDQDTILFGAKLVFDNDTNNIKEYTYIN